MLPYVYRITKYDPSDRDERGYYTGTQEAVSDHGLVEAAYLQAVAAFAEDSGVRHLAVREPQAPLGFVHFGAESAVEDGGLAGLFPSDLTGFHDGAQVTVPFGLELVRAMLRDSGAWCRLEVEGTFAVHVGWDQYVYVGSNVPCEAALARTRELGLFPEPLDASPYEAVFEEPGEQRPADDDFWTWVRRRVATREAALLEEIHVDNASRWHRIGDGTLDAVRARLTPRARLAVWPDLSTDVAAVVAALPDEGLVECVWEDHDGRITGMVADETEFTALAARVLGARAAAVLPTDVERRSPLLTAVLPDEDGVLRARWRTEPTPGDRQWAFLKTLGRGQVVTGTVIEIASFGVTFVDIGGFTAMINIPELSWRPIGHPSDVVVVGGQITAEVLGVDLAREQVPLSLKGLQEDPMLQIARQVGRTVTGEVTKVAPEGLFVRIEDRADGFQGLVHNAELAQPPADRPEGAVRVGDELAVMITDVDLARRRITLARTRAFGPGAQEDRHA
ncbi:S1 RNA-binding domain-containing protein [Kitasatospora sp. NPDC002965]|uniref:S1 RNA-binding domain-containing protein n=1 Tax=Kitasatospora sp. NPDC002965 TaxID=3154775 RepID=UPI0033BB3D6F